MKVLRVPHDSPYLYQLALMNAELDDIFSKAPTVTIEGVMANRTVIETVAQMNSSQVLTGEEAKQRPLDGDCAICFDDMQQTEKISFCRTCGNNLHTDCLNRWKKAKQVQGARVTCVYCRADWADGLNPRAVNRAGSSLRIGEEGYINFGDIQEGCTSEREYSSYDRAKGYRRSWYDYYDY